MEPTDARRMVPCFDEPEFKAVWRIKAIHPVGTSAVSNGIEISNAEKTCFFCCFVFKYGSLKMQILRKIDWK